MASFNMVNFSLRPSKSIQRSLVFEAVRQMQAEMDLADMVYIGFGSIWFTDFQMAHRLLHIRDMISIEADDIGFKRAVFNRPYATVSVRNGMSFDVLPTLFADPGLSVRPWLIWLDYTRPLEEPIIEEIRTVIEKAPLNSVFLTTFSAAEGAYGKPAQRSARIKSLLGLVVPDDLSRGDCGYEKLSGTLAALTLDFMTSAAAAVVRPGGFVPAFRLAYRDTTPMVTVGGVLPSKGAVPAVRAVTSRASWPAHVAGIIKAPHLTMREAAVLQAELPCAAALSRSAVQGLGFDLEEGEIEAFQRYYQYYPTFAQIMT